MVDAKKDPHLESRRHRAANGVADLASIQVHEIHATGSEAEFHVADVARQSVRENRLGAIMVALGTDEKISRVAEEFSLKVGEVAEAEIRRP